MTTFEMIMFTTAKMVVEHIHNNEAILLPTVYKQHVSNANKYKTSVHLGTEALKQEDIPSRQWVVSMLHMHLRGLIEIQCKRKRYGSVIYLHDCDLVQALSSAFGKSQRGSTYHSSEMDLNT